MPAQRQRPAIELTGHDRELLAFMAEHRLVRADHIRALPACAPITDERLEELQRGGLIRREPVSFDGQPAAFQITTRGLRVIGRRLPTPRSNLQQYAHDVGLAWLWLAAQAGAFGQLREIISERSLRSLDGPGRRCTPPLAVRRGGVGPGGQERLHYPDLLLLTRSGRRIALELELSTKAGSRREEILSAYGADPRVDAVIYLVADRAVGRALAASVRRLGVSQLVRIQKVRLEEAVGDPRPGRLELGRAAPIRCARAGPRRAGEARALG